MTATALNTFGVDATLLQSRLPQVGMEGSSDVLTTARVTEIVEDAASEVCAVLIAAGLPVADIAADTASVAYRQTQRLICDLAIPLLLRGVQGSSPGMSAALETLEERARKRLERIEDNPTVIGYDSDTDTSPGVWSSTGDLDDLADTHPAVAREWVHSTDGTRSPQW